MISVKKRIINQKATKDRLKELRIANGYSQDNIAKMIGGSRSYYNSMESGNRKLNKLYLSTLADLYGIELDEICIYEQSDYDELEELMNVLDSYRPSNYYMLRHGNLAEDLVDLIKYFKDSNITKYNLLDPIFNSLGYDVKLINIQSYLEKLNSESSIKNPRIIRTKAKRLRDYFGNESTKTCVLLVNRYEEVDYMLLSTEKFINFEDYIYNSVIGNLEKIADGFHNIYRIDKKNIDSIISENTEIDDDTPSLVKSTTAKEHLFKIEEYIEKILDLEDQIKSKSKKESKTAPQTK